MKVFRLLFHWLCACRPRTLLLSIASVGLATALAYQGGYFCGTVLLWLLLTSVGLQILSNLANDLGDSLHGIDHLGRKGPIRMAQSGALSPIALRRGIQVVAVLVLCAGLRLIGFVFGWASIYFWVFLGLGLLSIWAALRYAYGRRPYGHLGGGDLAVWLFFGLLGVKGAYFMYTQRWDWEILLPAVALGNCAVAVMNLNNLRDLDSDKQAGKRSMALRLGQGAAIHYHRGLLFGAMASLLLYAIWYLPWGWSWLFVFVYPFFVALAYGVRKGSSAEVLDRRLRQTVLLTLLLVCTYVAGVCLVTLMGG